MKLLECLENGAFNELINFSFGEVKNLFNPDSITIKGANNIGEVSDYLGFDEQQEAKLKLLFAE